MFQRRSVELRYSEQGPPEPNTIEGHEELLSRLARLIEQQRVLVAELPPAEASARERLAGLYRQVGDRFYVIADDLSGRTRPAVID